MDAPERTEAHRRLERLVGRWRGKETLHPSPMAPEGAEAVGEAENRLVLGGFGVLQEYQQRTTAGQPTFSGVGLFRYEPTTGLYQVHWFDSSGTSPNVFEGAWTEDVLEVEAVDDSGRYRSRYEFLGDDRYRFSLEASPDGEAWYPFMEGEYERVD